MKNIKKGFRLTDEEVSYLKKKLKNLQGAKHYDLRNRINGVLLVGDSGLKNEESAKICKVHVRTLRQWLARYREGGFAGLKRKSVSGRPSKLTIEQKDDLKTMVKGSPEAIGYDTGIWTAALACEVVWKRFGVRYSVQNMQRLLAKLGLSFKLPKKNLKEPTKQSRRSGWILLCPE